MHELPTVSYIVPCFNQAGFLYEAIASIMLSYRGPKEVFVIDDCSTDSASGRRLGEVRRQFPSVRIIQNEHNKGLPATRNAGLGLCSGEYVQFLDADDLLFPGKVDYQVLHFAYANELDISVADFLICHASLSDFSGITPALGTFELSLDAFLHQWERGLMIPIHSALFRRTAFSGLRFDESLRGKEDWVFWCRQAADHKRMAFLNVLGAAYRQHQKAMTKEHPGEMGRMWIRAALLINEMLGRRDESFLADAWSWYHSHYEPLRGHPSASGRVVQEFLNGQETAPGPIVGNPISKPEAVVRRSRKPRFSIVVPVYNHYEYLGLCFQSLLDQTHTDYEIILVDDHSSDARVLAYLRELERRVPTVRLLTNTENLGVAATINKALDASRGEYIAFVDCDDYLPSNALQEVSLQLEREPDIDYCFSDKTDVDEKNRFIRKAVYGGYANIRPSGDIKDDLLDGMVASHLKVIRKSKIVEVGGCDPALDGVQDYYLALRIAETGRFKYVAKALYYHRQHANAVTTADTTRQFRQTNVARRRICERWYAVPEIAEPQRESIARDLMGGRRPPTGYLETRQIRLFEPTECSLAEIKAATKAGNVCIFDSRGSPRGGWAYMLREFNSYFDLIVVTDPKTALFLLGYLWDYRILAGLTLPV